MNKLSIEKYRVAFKDLYHSFSTVGLNFKSTAQIHKKVKLIGQERAITAIELGVNVKDNGYNIYISGPDGTGRTSYIMRYLKKVARRMPTPSDICFIHNFEHPEHPKVIMLPAGKGKEFSKAMEENIEQLKIEIQQAFESTDYENRIASILHKYNQKKQVLFEQLNEKAKDFHLIVRWDKFKIAAIPAKEDGSPYTEQEFRSLTEEQKMDFEKRQEKFSKHIRSFLRKERQLDEKINEEVKKLQKELGEFVVGNRFDSLEKKFKEHKEVLEYLKEVKEHILSNLGRFMPKQKPQLPFFEMIKDGDFREYRVNLVVDNSGLKGAPIVYEPNPTFYNLFGKIDKSFNFGMYQTDFTMIKAGSLCKANGGFIVLNALDLLRNFGVWDGIKRVIENKEIRIEEVTELYGLPSISTLRPMPIPVNLKIIIIGSSYLYHLLYNLDQDFKKMFKVRADFNYEMDRKRKTIDGLIAFIAEECRRNGFRHLSPSGVAAVIEYASRIVDDKDKLTARLGLIKDLLLEASYWAGRDHSRLVTRKYVEKAILERKHRSDAIEEKIREMIIQDTLMIDTTGNKVGQINGLSVISLGDHIFGRPQKITARVFLGQKGVINIEREAKLSGTIHDKGVLILGGFLGWTYGRFIPLSISATLCFEQTYSMIDGDSASAAELFVLLSTISEKPINQSFAVTGSINQFGEIQPVGGINEKIEGFFRVCKEKGLTGEQGVIIPRHNIRNLMLDRDVRNAVRAGKFHIYAISHINEGIEILFGLKAGEQNKDGSFPKGTLNYFVFEKLKEYNEILRKKDQKEQKKVQRQKNDRT